MHQPPFLRRYTRGADFSAHYSKSQNFQPADARIDIYGGSIHRPAASSEDRGFSVGLFGGKLQTRSTGMRPPSSRASLGLSNTLIDVDALIVRFNTPAALAAAGWKGPPQVVKDLVNWQETQTPSQVSGVT